MDEREVATAVAGFLAEVTGIETTYDYPVANTSGPLPDMVVFATEKLVTDHPPEEVADLGLQNVWARIFTLECSLMVEVAGQTDEDASDADAALRAFGADIEEAIHEDLTLGGRVTACSPRLAFDYGTPFVERADKVRGRMSVLTLQVVEPVSEPG